MTKRLLVLCVAALVGVSVLVGCGSGDEPTVAPEEAASEAVVEGEALGDAADDEAAGLVTEEAQDDVADAADSDAGDGEASETATETAASQTIGESSVITAENNEEFAQVLLATDPGDSMVAAFAYKYVGRTIEFDAKVLDVQRHGTSGKRYDYLIGAGNGLRGPNFKFEDVGISELNWTGGSADRIPADTPIRCVARILRYNDMQEILFLEPVETSPR